MANILGLKDWIVLEIQRDTHNMRILAEKPIPPDVCPRCGVENPRAGEEGAK